MWVGEGAKTVSAAINGKMHIIDEPLGRWQRAIFGRAAERVGRRLDSILPRTWWRTRPKLGTQGKVKDRGQGWGEKGLEGRGRDGVEALVVTAKTQHNMEVGRGATGAIGGWVDTSYNYFDSSCCESGGLIDRKGSHVL